MKNKIKKWCVTIFLLGVFSAVLTGCSSSPAEYEEKDYSVSVLEIDTITIDVKNRKIEVLPSEDEKIYVSYYESKKESYEINLNTEKELSITGVNQKNWNDYIGKKASQEVRTIQVWVPDEKLNNLNIKTSNEDITLPELTFTGAVNIAINNGNIQLDKLNVGTEAALKTKNGSISGSIMGSYDEFSISSEAKKGENDLPASKDGGAKKLSAYTNNGNITLEFVK